MLKRFWNYLGRMDWWIYTNALSLKFWPSLPDQESPEEVINNVVTFPRRRRRKFTRVRKGVQHGLDRVKNATSKKRSRIRRR